MRSSAILLGLLAGLIGRPAAAAPPLPRTFVVEHYEATITPDLAAQRLAGEVSIRFHSRAGRIGVIDLDAGSLEIAAVTDSGVAQYTERKGTLLIVVLGKPADEGEARTIAIRYRAAAAKGLVFYPGQVYTSFFTSDWLPSSDRPDDRATLRLRISADPQWKVAASGRLAATTTENGRAVTEWRIETPTPPFLFAFAAGNFTEATSQRDKLTLRILAPAGLSTGPIADATATALQFFADRSGTAYPLETYTQVFAQGDVRQEAVGLTLLPASYGEGLAKQPDDLWLLAHELAHQWWGVGIPCADWSDFWLSEGLATFMADAFLEHRYGKARYQREIEQARSTYESLRDDGKDRPLSFTDWQTPQQAGGSIPYYKGAWVLDQLRRQLTDPVFWRGLRRYSIEHWGKPVTSDDFERSIEAAAGKNLTKFFEKWVTGCCVK